MTLASGSDVKIGSYEFDLEWSAEEPYAHNYESLYSEQQDIIGLDAQTADPNVLLWSHDDFAGGGELKYYDPEQPDSYWYSNSNPRVRGSITSPPDTGGSTGTLTAGSATEWHTVQTGGKFWAAANRELFYSSDGESWTSWGAPTALFGAGYTIHGMTHDGYFPIVWADNGSTVSILKVTSTTTSTAFVTAFSNSFRTYGGAMLEGKAYFWTGKQLLSFDTTASLPIVYDADEHVVHEPFDPNATGTYNAGIASSENSILYFTSSAGATHVFEYRFSSTTSTFVPRPIWTPSIGFTASHIKCSMAVVYLLGDYTDQVALMGMSLVNREPLFLTYVAQAYGGNGITLTPRSLASSYAAQMLIAVDDGTTSYIFVYDAEVDALTALDTLAITTHGTAYAVGTFKNRRLAFANKADTTARFRYWKQDFDTPSGAWSLVTAAYHMGYPMDEKLLFAFEVTQDPTIVAGTVQVEYQLDESGTWVSAGTTSAGVKYTKLAVATSNAKGRILRMRITGANGARVFSVTARTYLNAYQETWRLVLKTNDEGSGFGPRNRQKRGWELRDYIISLGTTKSTVTFLDGTRYPKPGGPGGDAGTGYTTHTVVVEFPKYAGVRTKKNKGSFEGTAEVVLRAT